MRYIKGRTKINNIDLTFLILTLFCFVFVSNPNGTIFGEPRTFYIQGLPVFFVVPLSIVIIIFYIIRRGFGYSMSLDKISLYLFLRCYICILPLLYMTYDKSFTAHYPVVVYSLFSYIIAFSIKRNSLDYIDRVFFIFLIVIELQVWVAFLSIDMDYLNVLYKGEMNIPIGGSNIIACYITPVFWLVYFNLKLNKKVRIILIFTTIFALILTKSRGGITVMTTVFIIYRLFLRKKRSSIKSILMAIIFIALVSYISSIPEVQMLIKGYDQDSANINANSLTSGRLNLFSTGFDSFLKHPIFGNGMFFNSTTTKAGTHNFIIELLAQSGSIGMLLYIIPVLIILHRSFKIRFQNGAMGWTLMFLSLNLHALGEVCLFNYSGDFLYWYAGGIIMSYFNSKKNEKLSTNIGHCK